MQNCRPHALDDIPEPFMRNYHQYGRPEWENKQKTPPPGPKKAGRGDMMFILLAMMLFFCEE